jgi:uncharacterized Fe-S center protein
MKKQQPTPSEPAKIYFADIRVKRLEAKATLPAKFQRMLDCFPLESMFKDKRVAVKMHLGENLGYSTVHPLFLRLLGEKLKNAGAIPFVTDGPKAVRSASARGYTYETIGMPIVPVSGSSGEYFRRKRTRGEPSLPVEIAGEIYNADAMIVLSHVKGHGDCGFGGACKNIAMGCVTGRTRGEIHRLEGGLIWDRKACIACRKCVEVCPNNAARFDVEKKEFSIFFHHCTYCQHCALACPKHAITIKERAYEKFMEGMCAVTELILGTFPPDKILYINVLLNITVYCDCWGMTTPSLVPDIGILAGTDIVAIEKASLDLIKTENFLPSGLPIGRKLGKGKHLFEKIHAKDPYVLVNLLEKRGLGTSRYQLIEVE